MLKVVARLLPLLLLFHFYPDSADAQQPSGPPSLNLGDAIVTGFSGTVAPDPTKPLPAGKSAVDLTFINPDGPSARIMDVRQATATLDDRDLPATLPFDVYARDVGQVFGIALDDQAAPNIYLSATSAFGLQLVGRGPDGKPARVKQGGPGEAWMKGQFGVDLGGGPGSIFKVDGKTGVVSLFANVALDSVPNPAAALGSLAFDAAHQQLFVSDRYTGMIHRFDLNGNDLGHFDHGVTGRTAAQLAPVVFDPSARPNIAVATFDTLNRTTWGIAPPLRSVWGLAVHEGRLFYAVAAGPQIWSVGIQQDGSFAADPHWELDVPAPGPYEVSDILFSQQGAMILAQRAQIKTSYDYSAFTQPGQQPRVLRFWLKGPNDPPSPGSWKPVPEEYAVGFAGDYRNTNGGVALGYDYGPDGALNTASCEATLWTTGQDLRDDPALQTQLLPGGPLVVHGLFVVPANLVRPSNQPPLTSYSVDYDSAFHDPAATGHLGQVRIFTTPCAAGQNGGTAVSGGAPAGGGGGNGVTPGGGGGVTPGGGGCVGPNCNPCPQGSNSNGGCNPPGQAYDLAIIKTASPSTTVPGGFNFTLTVTNPGTAFTATNNTLTVTDAVPAGMTFTNVNGAPAWTCTPATPISTGSITCTFNGTGTIASGATLAPILITATAANYGTYNNCAAVQFTQSSGLQDSNPANNNSCATVNNTIDLAIGKQGGPIQRADGGPGMLEFDLGVTNLGAWFTAANNVVVTDTVPAGLTFTSINGLPNWSCPTGPFLAGQTFTCTYMAAGQVGPGQYLGTIQVFATVSSDPPPRQVTNCANVGLTSASGLQDSNPANNQSCITFGPNGFVPVTPNPSLPTACGFNVIFVIDESASMNQSNTTLPAALASAAHAFNVNNAMAEVIFFSDTAHVQQPMSTSTWSNLLAGYNPNGATNWEAGLQLASQQTIPSNTVVIFITDGDPNEYLAPSSGTPLLTTNVAAAANAATTYTNILHGMGVPVIAFGILGASTPPPVTVPILQNVFGLGSFYTTTYGGIGGDLSTYAVTLCPGLYLTKSFSQQAFNYYGLTKAPTVDVTLSLTNHNATVVPYVEVHDDLPANQLMMPITNISASLGTGSLVGPISNVPASSKEVKWTITNFPAGATATLTYQVTLPFPWSNVTLVPKFPYIYNYAQVYKATPASSDGAATPNNMPNAVSGPNHEVDEATAYLFVYNQPPQPPYYCTKPLLVVAKHFNGEVCLVNTTCSFTITVTAECASYSQTKPSSPVTSFTGPVTFADGVYPNPKTTVVPISTASISAPVVPIGNTPPTTVGPCAWTPSSTSLPASCTSSITDLPFGQSITYAVSFTAPTPPGNYMNCFWADGQTPNPPQNFNAVSTDVSPLVVNSSGVNSGNWADCEPFPVGTETDLPRKQCLPPETLNAGGICVCPPPLVKNPATGRCGCPEGTALKGRECVRPILCIPPQVLNAAGTACVCPPPLVMNPATGQCGCPRGTALRGNECVRPIECKSPQVLNAAGTACMCPPPLVMNPATGQCGCPEGTVLQGKECVRQITCPRGTTLRGQQCVPSGQGGSPGRGGAAPGGGGGGRRQ